jgi:hypothetical protein
MGQTEGWSTILLYAEAGIALYGNILFWLGGWTALDVDIWPRTWQRDSMYILVGSLLLVVTDSWYANAGISGGHLPHLSLRFTSKFFWSAFEFVKCAAGMFGGMLLWLGLYNIYDNEVPPYTEIMNANSSPAVAKFWVSLALGLLIIFATKTLFAVAGESVAWELQQNDVPSGSSLLTHAHHSIRALFSMIGQTLVWFGAYGAAEYICYVSPCTVIWKELFLSTAGLALLFLFDSFVEVSLVDTADVFNDLAYLGLPGRSLCGPPALVSEANRRGMRGLCALQGSGSIQFVAYAHW